MAAADVSVVAARRGDGVAIENALERPALTRPTDAGRSSARPESMSPR